MVAIPYEDNDSVKYWRYGRVKVIEREVTIPAYDPVNDSVDPLVLEEIRHLFNGQDKQ